MGKILFVDDDLLTRKLVSRLIERLGHEVILAEGVRAAMPHLEGRNKPDMVISDLAMPDQDGIDLLNYVRSQRWGRNMPFIILTARPIASNSRLAQEANASEFLAKPIQMDVLAQVIARYIR